MTQNVIVVGWQSSQLVARPAKCTKYGSFSGVAQGVMDVGKHGPLFSFCNAVQNEI